MLHADAFYLIAHNETSGQCRLHPKVAGFGVAAALLAELVLADQVTIVDRMVKAYGDATPNDPLTRAVLGEIRAEPAELHVRDWLAYLSRSAVDDVAQRLVQQGVLERTSSWLPRAGARRYVAVSPNDAAWPNARITSRLTRCEQMDLPDQLLAGLCRATGLTEQMLWDDRDGASRRYLRSVVAGLPEPLGVLVSEVESAAGKVAVTRS